MTQLPRLHWSTLGDDTGGLEHRWAALWDVTVDRGTAPALAPRDVDLWVISAKGALAPPELNRMMAEVAALPILLGLKPDVDWTGAAIGERRVSFEARQYGSGGMRGDDRLFSHPACTCGSI